MDLKHTIKEFCDQCVTAKIIYNEYISLFESNEKRLKLFEEVAINFFHDLQDIFIKSIIQNICNLTDRADSRNDNLTVKYIIGKIGPDVSEKLGLDDLSEKMHAFRDCIAPARNKIISHLDRNTVLRHKTLGAFPEGEIDKFWDTLQEFVNKLHDYYLDGILPLNAHNPDGADELVETLKKAVHYEDYFNDKPDLKFSERSRMRFKDA